MDATGPRTPAGKSRSSLNSLKHGLAAVHLVMPGEDREEYVRRMDGVFTALAPADDAQAQLVALIGDDLHKLDRLLRVEEAMVGGRVEELLAQTSTGERATVIASAISTFGMALTRWSTEPVPAPGSVEYSVRLRGMSKALDLVADSIREVDELVEECRAVVLQLSGRVGRVPGAAPPAGDLDAPARSLMAALLALGEREEAAQEEMRKRISTIALPAEAELKKLQRYRKLVEEGLQRRLAALDQLRRLTAAQVTAEGAEKAKEYRLRLRLVP